MPRSTPTLGRDRRGAVYVEYLLAFVPVVAFFISTSQFIELCAADLVLKRAASAAARAAVVVLPDDFHFYEGAEVNQFVGERKSDVMLAAAIVLGTMCVPNVMSVPSHFTTFDVTLDGEMKESKPLTATVKASFYCGTGWASLVCGGATRQLTAKATYAYQGAGFKYEL
jgi:hypothetical protein